MATRCHLVTIGRRNRLEITEIYIFFVCWDFARRFDILCLLEPKKSKETGFLFQTFHTFYVIFRNLLPAKAVKM